MPTFRRLHCIFETVRQLTEAQSRAPFEVIVVNNDPTNGSERAIASTLEPLLKAGWNIRITSCTTGKQGAARNHGLSMSRGDYVAFVDDDDDYTVDYIEKLAGALDLGLKSVRCRIQTCGMAGPDCTGHPTIAHHPLSLGTMARRSVLTPTWNDPPNEDRDYWNRHPVQGAIDDCLVVVCRGSGKHSPRNKAQGGSWRTRFLIVTRPDKSDSGVLPSFLSALREQTYENFILLIDDSELEGKSRKTIDRIAASDDRIRIVGDHIEKMCNSSSGTSTSDNAIRRLLASPILAKAEPELGFDDIVIPLLASERLSHSGVLSRLSHVFSEHPDVWATYGSCLLEPRNPAWPLASFPPSVWANRTFRALPSRIGEFAPLALRVPLLATLCSGLPRESWLLPNESRQLGEEAILQLMLLSLEAAGREHTYHLADCMVIKSLVSTGTKPSRSTTSAVEREFALRAAPAAPALTHLDSSSTLAISSNAPESDSESLAQEPARVAPRPVPVAPVLWAGPFYDPSGYGNEARSFVKALDRLGTTPILRSVGSASGRFRESMEPAHRDRLDMMVSKPDPDGKCIGLIHLPPSFLERFVSADYMIARTMFETDGLPADMVARCNEMDEIWVPSKFNQETFRKAGVKTKIVCIPGAINSDRFAPGQRPFVIPDARTTVYLSTIEWKERKGWRSLVQAWADAFTRDEDVCLVFRSSVPGSRDGDHAPAINRDIDAFLASIGRQRSDIAPIIVLGYSIPDSEIPALYAAAAAYVAPSSGEGWGYPYMEAMSSGLPTIATRWSANLEYMNDSNSLLCDVEGMIPAVDPFLSGLNGQHWARPSVKHLTCLLRSVVDNQSHTRAIARTAREDMKANWSWDRVGNLVQERLADISRRPRLSKIARSSDNSSESICTTGPIVRWEGPFFTYSSLGSVNRELGSALIADARITLVPRASFRNDFLPSDNRKDGVSEHIKLAKRLGSDAPGPAAVHVGHQWPPSLHPPSEGAWVLFQPWEYGGLPGEWLPVIRDQVDELWVYSSWQRDCAILSGVPESRVAIVPIGVDINRFRPDGPVFKLKTRKRFKFLAVGGIIPRKGMEILVQSYLKSFSKNDDVCLVIKGLSSRWAYNENQGQKDFAELPALVSASGGPEIEFIGETMNDDAMASLYRACDAYVAPFRGEGFGLPIAEAMASGLPVIVTKAGPALDICDHDSAYFIDCEEREVPSHIAGLDPGAAGYWWAEPDVDSLAEHMLNAVNNRETALSKGQRARQRIVSRFNYNDCAKIARNRLLDLSTRQPVRFAPPPAFTPHGPAFQLDHPRGTVILFQPNWRDPDWRDVARSCYLTYSSSDDISLVLTLDPCQGLDVDTVGGLLKDLKEEIGIVDEAALDVLLVTDQLDDEVIASLYRASDFVLVSPRDIAARHRAAAVGVPSITRPGLALAGLNVGT